MNSGYTGSDNEYDQVSHINEINPESDADLNPEARSPPISEVDSIYKLPDDFVPEPVEYDEVTKEIDVPKSSSIDIYAPEYMPPSKKSSEYKPGSKKSTPEQEYDDVTHLSESENFEPIDSEYDKAGKSDQSEKKEEAQPDDQSQSNASIDLYNVEYDEAPYDCKYTSLQK